MNMRGFTLIELLVAITIFAMMAAMAWRGLDAMARSRAHLAAENRQWQDVALLFQRMEDDVTHATNRPWRDQNGNLEASWQAKPWVGTSNSPNDAPNADANVVMVSLKADERGLQKVGYRFVQGEVDTLWWPTLDDAPSQQPQIYPLLTGVKSFALRYLTADGQWVDHWPLAGQTDALPRAVEVSLTLLAGSSLHRVFALP